MVILTNYHGADIYAIAKALYANVPDYTCGNAKDDKVNICFYGRNLCLRRPVASLLMRYGAFLGECVEERKLFTKSGDESTSKVNNVAERKNNLSAFPNPFSNNISFVFNTAEKGNATLKLYDVNGKLVGVIFNGAMLEGSSHSVNFDGSKLPAGIYISRLQTVSGSIEQKLVKSR